MIQNHWDAGKEALGGKFNTVWILPQETREFSSKQPQFIPKGTRRKDKQTPKKLKTKTQKSEQK